MVHCSKDRIRKQLAILLVMMLCLAGILSNFTLTVEAKSAKPKAPVITYADTTNTTATLAWNKAKGAKKYQVARVVYSWKKYKKVAKTAANKEKYTKEGKYKVKASGKKYQVYKAGKKKYTGKKLTTQLNYKWKGLIPDCSYTFAVRSCNGKKHSKWRFQRVRTSNRNEDDLTAEEAQVYMQKLLNEYRLKTEGSR